ncbi:GDP-mannose-dependent alpha-(1-6)-phosphatidylinositol monomannoside mannosyltransferase [Candidatus Calditenuaceae archaeon HR02]|nr:GDP-mannose-dependent alpha-(1-6)-phosphatidylinositol monomannoside mannosyltransferase [Candidatus Calditenuaceae archaeon HR02]
MIAQEPTLRVGVPALLQSKVSTATFACEVHSDYLRPAYLPWKDLAAAVMVLRSANIVRAVNKRIAESVKSYGVENVYVIPSVYVKMDVFKSTKPPKERGPVILSASRLVPQKGLELLLNAVRLLLRDFPKLDVRVVGEGPEKARLMGLAKTLGVDSAVRFYGWVDQDELVRHYNDAAVFVCTSYHEGGPRTVFEAAACLTPTVSTPVGMVVEALKDGESVLIVKERSPELLAEKIADLLSNPVRRAEIAERAREVVVKEFEWEKSVQRYAEQIRKLVTMTRH